MKRTKQARTERTRVVAYIRVSTDKQAEKGVSLDAQTAKVEAYAALYDLDLVGIVVDAQSAKNLDREKLQEALGMLGTAADALLVVKLDRLTRSVKDLGTLVETYFGQDGYALFSVGEQIDTRTAAGRLVLNVLASVAQWERETVGERTAAAMTYKQSQGEYIGGRTPYGYRLSSDGTHLEEDPAEQAVIGEARELKAAGLSLRAVAVELNKRGRTARNGKTFQATQISRMVEVA